MLPTNNNTPMDDLDTDLWSEINDSQGEIFDIPMQDNVIDFQQALTLMRLLMFIVHLTKPTTLLFLLILKKMPVSLCKNLIMT